MLLQMIIIFNSGATIDAGRTNVKRIMNMTFIFINMHALLFQGMLSLCFALARLDWAATLESMPVLNCDGPSLLGPVW